MMDLTRETYRGGAPALRRSVRRYPGGETSSSAPAQIPPLPLRGIAGQRKSTRNDGEVAPVRSTSTRSPFFIFRFSFFISLILVTGCDRLHNQISAEHHGPAWEHHAEEPAEPIEGADRFTADIATVAHHGTENGEHAAFRVAARTPHLVQAPCSECHADGNVKKPEGSPRPAHWQITKAHGRAADLTCASCHPADKPETLRTIHGKNIDLDHSYVLCGTCHFEQLRDWRGGAHGKRLGAWSGERVVQSCTGCHDPHDPTFPVREPAIFNPPPKQPGDQRGRVEGPGSKVESGENE